MSTIAGHGSPVTDRRSRIAGHGSPVTDRRFHRRLALADFFRFFKRTVPHRSCPDRHRTGHLRHGERNWQANQFYDNLLSIQNAASLQWPASNPANASKRAEFLLETFPPRSSGGKTPTPTPPTPTPPQ